MLRSLSLASIAFSTVALRLGTYLFIRWIASRFLWPAILFFWMQFILSFIVAMYVDTNFEEVTIEETSVIEIVDNKAVAEVDMLTVETTGLQTKWWKTLLLGVPNANPWISFATILINALLVLMTLDFTFRTHLFYPATDIAFHRPVATSPYSANVFIRSPNETQLVVYYKPMNTPRWEEGSLVGNLSNLTDFTAVVKLDNLRPETTYQYAVLPRGRSVHKAGDSRLGQFETFPPTGKRGRWSFGSSSCIKSWVPYNPFDNPLRIKGLEYLQQDMSRLKFFTFLGTAS
jgi:alkaline phosphatase D